MSGLALLLAMGLVAAPADQKAEARKLIDRGNRAFSMDNYADALAAFEAAYEAFPSPKILLNVAEAHRALDHPVEAVAYYERFLREAEDAGDLRADVESRIGELQSSVGRLRIDAPDDASVAIDGRTASTDHVNVVAPGRRSITATREGFHDFEETTEVPAATETIVRVKMVPLAPPPIVAVDVPPPETTPITEKWWFWTGIGAAVVVVVGVSVAVATSGGDDFLPMGELGNSQVSDWNRF